MNDSVQPVATIPKDDMRAEIEKMKRAVPILMEYAELIAQIRKAGYDAYIKQGFTPEQALQLCCKA